MDGYEQIGMWFVRALSFLGVYVSSLACMILISAAAPGFLSRVVSEARSGMRRCFLWGTVFTINLVLLAAFCAQLDNIVGPVCAIAAVVILLIVSMGGLAAIGCEIGRRVLMMHDRPTASVLSQIVVGVSILFVTAVIPVLGWLVFAGAMLTGIGAFLESAVADYTFTLSPTNDSEKAT
jgi:hypothetical protein